MDIPFIKMHGLGNDYVYIDCFPKDTAKLIAKAELSVLAQRVSDRHFGIGSDGLVLIMPSKVADVRMRMFNADGSEAEMCGNAARCVAKFTYEHGLCGNPMTLETLAGIKHITLQTQKNRITSVTVEMGTSMGNPHKVIITEEPVAALSLYSIEGTNVEWINVLNRREIAMRVWERGTGETMACGTGACAAVMAAIEQGLTDNEVTVHLRGGDLLVRRDQQETIFMTGPATEVFRGIYHWED
ncbi:MAG: diaminopimelate epimerase [Paludibacteraceae bacterium]|nr:diaminopimelate epimerase [Paludibacteraceae bacterium]